VVHAYAEYGAGCVHLFNGIFAFAIWEEKKQRLFLARDRIGVKPLFYMEQGNTLLFASEIKTILACPGVRARLDREGAAQLLLLGPGRLPGSGVFRDVREVEPGSWAFYQDGKLFLHQYWHLTDREHREPFRDTLEYVRYLVTDAIKRQMVSDVTIGTFLSGGLDSSLISAVCAREMAERGERLHTFSVDYVDHEKYFRPGKFQPSSDSHYIRLMARELGTEVIDEAKLLELLGGKGAGEKTAPAAAPVKYEQGALF
jgi:asparagine synthase (glutamine-hydrolysing)